MPDIKPEAEILYDERRWRLLETKRKRAIQVLEILHANNLEAFVYGSVARGDVTETSDVDIVIPQYSLPSSLIEALLSESMGAPLYREIVQATPKSTPKYYIHFDYHTIISMPVGRLRQREREFYKFGGQLNLNGLRDGKRVPGVNKELKLIIPTSKGHLECPVVGYEELVAKIIGVSKGIVEERIRILTRRREKGTTGLYLNYRLQIRESFEEAVDKLKRMKKGFRARLAEDGI